MEAIDYIKAHATPKHRYRVWHCVASSSFFYVPVSSPREGKNMIDFLRRYDTYLLRKKEARKLFTYASGLEEYDAKVGGWYEWYAPSGNNIMNATEEEM